MRCFFIPACVAIALSVASAPASAQSARPDQRAAAETLFNEGRRLMALGRYAEACPAFEESQRLDAGIGTLLNLADCYEKSGRTASAWALFQEAATLSAVAGQAGREAEARSRAVAIEPRLCRLTIQIARAADQPDLTITRDGAVVGRALWGTPIPVDPGDHVLEATAPGKARFTTSVRVVPGARFITATIPLLEDAPPGGGERDGTGQRAVALAIGGLGVVSFGVTAAFGLQAISKNSDAKRHCDRASYCDAEGVSLRDDAQAAGNIATAAFIVGAAAVGVGATLYLTAPGRSTEGTRSDRAVSRSALIGLRALPTSAALVVGGAW